MKPKLLIVEDDPNLGEILSEYLGLKGFETTLSRDGEEGENEFKNGDFDLCILDLMMPKKDGFSLAKEIRAMDENTPIIFLTAKSMKQDIIKGFTIGADDYMTKPFNVRELLARIKAILRRGSDPEQKGQDPESDVIIGKLTLNFAGYTAIDQDNQEIHLSHKEIDIIRYLFERKNETVSRRELLENIWGYNETPTTRTVDNFILKIRQKLEDNPNSPKIIHTVHGIGYKLLA